MKIVLLFFLFSLIFFSSCSTDEEIIPPPIIDCFGCETGTITDTRDGSTYNTVRIGDQWWMAENLNVGTRINSDRGFQVQTDNNVIEKYCHDNRESNCDIYGGLYEWGEIMHYDLPDNGTIGTTQGICPEGWHLPTDAEWRVLTEYLGGAGGAGGKMKEMGTIHWDSPNQDATNESGFNALPGGRRILIDGSFIPLGRLAIFWASSEFDTEIAHSLQLQSNTNGVHHGGSPHPYGNSVRCVKD